MEVDTINNTNNALNCTTLENVSLMNIAGYYEEKEEIKKIINLFKDFNKLKELGISLPKGLILSGSPGVGKTLAAKVIANEAKIPFYVFEQDDTKSTTSNSKTIRKIYEEARKNAPSIVFIDELDKIAPIEGFVSMGGFISDDSRKELRVILQEIDGVESNNGVVTIATVNNYDELPSTIKRSGRMDKHIHFDMPDLKSREEIIKHYLKDKEHLCDVDVHEVAAKAIAMSGADLKTLVNEVFINMVSNGSSCVTTKDFVKTIPLITLKGIRKNSNGNDKQVIYHELGHFICEYKLNGNMSAISIEKIGNVEGYIMPMNNAQERKIYSKSMLANMCVVSVAGYAAEKIFLNETYDGVGSDFRHFQEIITRMAECGMLEVENIFSDKGEFFGQNLDKKAVEYKTKYFNEYLGIATNIINENRALIEFLYNEVLEKRSLEPEEVKQLVNEFNDRKTC